LPPSTPIWYNTTMLNNKIINSDLGDHMNITSKVFVSQNGMQQVEMNYDDKNRADVLHRQFTSSGEEVQVLSPIPTRKPITEVLNYITKLENDYRYIDVSDFSEVEVEEWRELARTTGERSYVINKSSGSPWRALGAGNTPKSFEEFFGCTPEEHYYG